LRRGYLAEMRGTLVKPANGGVRRGGRCGPKQGVVDRPPKECVARGADRRRGPGQRWPLLRWLPDGSGKRAWWKHVVTTVDWGDRHLDKWVAKRERARGADRWAAWVRVNGNRLGQVNGYGSEGNRNKILNFFIHSPITQNQK
jgi:hypothetical protein